MQASLPVIIQAAINAGRKVTSASLTFTGPAYTSPYGGRLATTTLAAEPAPEVIVNSATEFMSGLNASMSFGYVVCAIHERSTQRTGFFNIYPPIWKVDLVGRAQDAVVLDNARTATNWPPRMSMWSTDRWAIFAVFGPFNVSIIAPDNWFGTILYNAEVWYLPSPLSTLGDISQGLWQSNGLQSRYVAAGLAAAGTTPARPESIHPLGAGVGIHYGNNPTPLSGNLEIGNAGYGITVDRIEVFKENTADIVEIITYQNVGPNNQPVATIIDGVQQITTNIGAGTRSATIPFVDSSLGYAAYVRNAGGAPTAGGLWFVYSSGNRQPLGGGGP